MCVLMLKSGVKRKYYNLFAKLSCFIDFLLKIICNFEPETLKILSRYGRYKQIESGFS